MMPTPNKRPIVYAHRGAMAYAPQNTLPAFTLAWELGADGIELDVQLSSDGVPVVFHDDVLDALTDGSGPVAAHSLEELRRLDAGGQIPTLEEVLRRTPPNGVVNIEIKTALPQVPTWRAWLNLLFGYPALRRDPTSRRETTARATAAATAAVIRSVEADIPGLTRRLIVSSFDPIALEAFRSNLPEIRLGFLYSPNQARDTRPLMRAIPHEAWHPYYQLLTERAIVEAHERGQLVNAWTVDDPETARRLAEWGVDGIISNQPDVVLAALDGTGRADR